jgi:hypothetical protein
MFNYFRKTVMVSLFSICLCGGKINAQNLSVESVKLQNAYKNQAFLSFDVKYTYADASSPNTIIDSSFGQFKMSGEYYWGAIDSMEFMQNNNYSVLVSKSDKIMRIANPDGVYNQIINLAQFDSLIGKGNYNLNMGTTGNLKTIELVFTNSNFAFSKYKVCYDSATNWVTQIAYEIKEDIQDNEDSYGKSSSSSTYMVVTANFTNYQTAAFTNNYYNPANYFLPVGTTYVPQAPYSDYEVFVAAPNLIK